MEKKGGRVILLALIIRLNTEGSDGAKESLLIVIKIIAQKSCPTDTVKPMAKANEEARKLADSSAHKPCLAK